MHDFSGRSADRLAEALADPERLTVAKRRARRLRPGAVSANELYNALCGAQVRDDGPQTVFVRHRDGAATGPVTARIQRQADGGWQVRVRPHEQTPTERVELAEHVEALLAVETAGAAGVRLGRRLVALLSPEEAQDASRSWLEGCIWTAARGSGLDWDRWRCAAVADVLRSQPDGWETAVVQAIGGAEADPSGGKPGHGGIPGTA